MNHQVSRDDEDRARNKKEPKMDERKNKEKKIEFLNRYQISSLSPNFLFYNSKAINISRAS